MKTMRRGIELKTLIKKENIIPGLMGVVCLAVVISFTVYLITQYDPARFDNSYEKCKKDIENMKNISDDYRLGWNDCLNHFKMLWNSAINMTQRC